MNRLALAVPLLGLLACLGQSNFGDDAGTPVDTMPTTDAVVTLTPDDDGTTMVIHSTFPSAEAMQQLLAMGLEEGVRLAVGQIDALL